MESTSSKPLVRWIEISANIAIIVVAIIIALVFTKNYFSGSKEQSRSIAAGARLNQQPINWPASKKKYRLSPLHYLSFLQREQQIL
jgi:hypothetical protein